jgi:hypothetical protein
MARRGIYFGAASLQAADAEDLEATPPPAVVGAT